MTNTPSATRKGKWIGLAVRWGVILALIIAGAWYMTVIPGKSWSTTVPPLSSQERLTHDNLRRHLEMLAGQN